MRELVLDTSQSGVLRPSPPAVRARGKAYFAEQRTRAIAVNSCSQQATVNSQSLDLRTLLHLCLRSGPRANRARAGSNAHAQTRSVSP